MSVDAVRAPFDDYDLRVICSECGENVYGTITKETYRLRKRHFDTWVCAFCTRLAEAHKKPEILVVSSTEDDWVGVYKSGDLVFQGHSVSGTQMLEALGIPYRERELDFEAEDMTSCPQSEKDLPKGE